ncbi:MAG: hypothetical protein EPN36_16555 [Rhodanobacteraceae bacterium]|nr:MAG: hypothetical protein EPN36_16555 [Rhodanobacteraceae bacterium]
MRSFLKHNRRIRLRIALLAIVAMLFQQTALAAYVCSRADMPVGDTAMTMHYESMPMAQARHDPALCTLHCAHQAQSAQTVNVPAVPPLALPAILRGTFITSLALTPEQASYAHDPLMRSRGVSLALRSQILLI